MKTQFFRFRSPRIPVRSPWIRLTCAAAALFLTLSAYADTSFIVKQMSRNDVPEGKGQCDIRLQVDNQAEVVVRGDRVNIRTIAGRDPRDAGSECNFPFPTGEVNNFRWEKRDGRGRVELMEDSANRRVNRALFNVRDSDGGEGRYHIRLNWDIAGSSNTSDGRQGRPGRSTTSTRPGTSSDSGWGTARNPNSGSSNQDSGWGNSSGSGWGNEAGWGKVAPPANLTSNGRGTLTWDRRSDLTVSRSNIRVTGDRAIVRIETSANRTVEFRGRVTNSSNGFFEVDLDDSSEGAIDGIARVDYRNANTVDRIDLYGNSGNDRFRIDFRR